jgi:hypothetical protein
MYLKKSHNSTNIQGKLENKKEHIYEFPKPSGLHVIPMTLKLFAYLQHPSSRS